MQTIRLEANSHGMKRMRQFTVYLNGVERKRRSCIYVCICMYVCVAEDHTNQLSSTRNRRKRKSRINVKENRWNSTLCNWDNTPIQDNGQNSCRYGNGIQLCGNAEKRWTMLRSPAYTRQLASMLRIFVAMISIRAHALLCTLTHLYTHMYKPCVYACVSSRFLRQTSFERLGIVVWSPVYRAYV